MDSFFDYIIILFFIISALSSLFKQKKQKNEDSSVPDFPDLDFDREETGHAPMQRKEMETRNMEYDIDGTNEKPFEDEYSKLLEERAKRGPVDDYVPEEKAYDKIIVNEKAKSIQKKLKNPKSFREMYIVSELLNKPVGMREDG